MIVRKRYRRMGKYRHKAATCGIKYPAVTLGPLAPKAGERTNAAIRRRNGDGSAFRGERVQQVEISYNCVGVIELPGINKTA